MIAATEQLHTFPLSLTCVSFILQPDALPHLMASDLETCEEAPRVAIQGTSPAMFAIKNTLRNFSTMDYHIAIFIHPGRNATC